MEGRHTAIWEKRDGQWVIVHEHLSAPLTQPGEGNGPNPAERKA